MLKRSWKDRVVALSVAVLTMLSSGLSYAEEVSFDTAPVPSAISDVEVVPALTDDTGLEQVVPFAQADSFRLTLDMTSENGSLVVDEGLSTERRIRLETDDDGTLYSVVSDALGNVVSRTEITQDAPHAAVLDFAAGVSVSVKAVADDGYEVSVYDESFESQAGLFTAQDIGFNPDGFADYSCDLVMDANRAVSVSFKEASPDVVLETDVSVQAPVAVETERPSIDVEPEESADAGVVTETEVAAEDETLIKVETETPDVVSETENTTPETELIDVAPETETSVEEAAAESEAEETIAVEDETEQDAASEQTEASVIEVETEAVSEEPVSETAEEQMTESQALEVETEESVLEEAAEETEAPEENVFETEDLNQAEAFSSEYVFEKPDGFDDLGLDSADFASMRLVLSVSGEVALPDPGHVEASFENLYLMQYASVEQAMYAYAYYIGQPYVNAVEPDTVLTAAGEGGELVTEDLEDAVTAFSVLCASADGTSVSADMDEVIALLDTGVSEGKAFERVSLIDDELSGGVHGDQMADAIYSVNPNASVLSVRVLNSNGSGSVSSIVAGIEYAIDQGADIINLSISSERTLANSVVEMEIQKAIDEGIVVVGAAGNNGRDAGAYVPGCVNDAFIIGACDADGRVRVLSNFGTTVDYNVVAQYTSDAAAKFSGYVSLHGTSVEDLNKNGLIFATTFTPETAIDIPDEIANSDYINGIVKPAPFYVAIPFVREEFEDPFDQNVDFALEFADGKADACDVSVKTFDSSFRKDILGSYPITYTISSKDGSFEPFDVDSVVVVTNYMTEEGLNRLAEQFGVADILDENNRLPEDYLCTDAYKKANGFDLQAYWEERGMCEIPDDYFDSSIPYFNNLYLLFGAITDADMRPVSDDVVFLPDGSAHYTDTLTPEQLQALEDADDDDDDDNDDVDIDTDIDYKGDTEDLADPDDDGDGDVEYYDDEDGSFTAAGGSGSASCSGGVVKNSPSHWSVHCSSGPLKGKTISVTCANHTAALPYAGQSGSYTVSSSGAFIWTPVGATDGVSKNDYGLMGYQRGRASVQVEPTYKWKIIKKGKTATGTLKTIKKKVTFTIYRKVKGKWKKYMKVSTSSSSGKVKFELPKGQFKIKEKKAPKGYTKAAPIEIEEEGKKHSRTTITVIEEEDKKIEGATANVRKVTDETMGMSADELLDVDPLGGTPGDITQAVYVVAKLAANGTHEWEREISPDEDGFMDLNKAVANGVGTPPTTQPLYPDGSYVVYEKTSPYGYAVSGTQYSATVTHTSHKEGKKTVVVYTWTWAAGSTIIFLEDEPVMAAFETPGKARLVCYKKDKEGTPLPQGDADFSNVMLSVRNAGDESILIDSKTYEPDDEITAARAVCAPNGDWSAAIDLPAGTYEIFEYGSTNKYFADDGHSELVEIYEAGREANGTPIMAVRTIDGRGCFEDMVYQGGAEIRKWDRMLDRDMASGDLSFNGAQFAIVNASVNPAVNKDGRTVPSCGLNDSNASYTAVANAAGNCTMQTVTVDASGYGATGSSDLPYGTYYIIETSAPTGYFLNKDWVGKIVVREPDKLYRPVTVKQTTHVGYDCGAADDNTWHDSVVRNMGYRAGVHVRKFDYMRDTDKDHGDANLAGAKFAIVNASNHAVLNEGYGSVDGQPHDVAPSGLNKNSVTYDQVLAMVNAKYTSATTNPTVGKQKAGNNRYVMDVITTNAKGEATSSATLLPYGTYYIIEIEAPKGYRVNTNWVGKVVVREDGVIYGADGDDAHPVTIINLGAHNTAQNHNNSQYVHDEDHPENLKGDATAVRDQIFRAGIKLQKIDYEMQDTMIAQGIGELGGAEFTILNGSLASIRNENAPDSVDGVNDIQTIRGHFAGAEPTYDELVALSKVEEDGIKKYVVDVIKTNKDGYASTDKLALPYGTYYIVETKAPYGYYVDDTFVGKAVIRDDNMIVNLGETGVGTSKQTSFTDVDRTARNTNSLVDGGDTVDEQVRRSDLYCFKLNDDGEYKPFIPFMISAIRKNPDGSETVLERHVVVSDEVGYLSTAAKCNNYLMMPSNRPHDKHTNGFDQYVDFDNAIINEAGQALLDGLKNGSIAYDSDQDVSTWGVWFQGNTNQYPKTAIRNDFGALYPGYYRITELKCEDNKQHRENMVDSKLIYVYNDTVDSSSKMTTNNKPVYYHPLVDLHIRMESYAQDVESETKTVPARKSVDVFDWIRMVGVSADHKYRVAVQWRDLTDNGRVLKVNMPQTDDGVHLGERVFLASDDGSEVNSDGQWIVHEFQPAKDTDTNNTSAQTHVYASLNTKALNGHQLQATVYLYEYIQFSYNDQVGGDWVLVQVHADGDVVEDECLYVPDLNTTARDKWTGDREGAKRPDDVILDTVEYKNLYVGDQYVIGMKLLDPRTGEPLVKNEDGSAKEVFSSRIWRNYKNDEYVYSGTKQMPELPIDSSMFEKNQSAIVVEALYRAEDDEDGVPHAVGEPLVVHDSLLDEDQTIRWPDVHTMASDWKTQDDVGTSADDAIVYDDVKLTNVIFDDNDHEQPYVYKVTGHLVYQKDFTDANGVEHKEGDVVETLDGTQDTVTIVSDAAGNITFEYEDGTAAQGEILRKINGFNVGHKVHPENPADNSYVKDSASAICDLTVRMVYHVKSSDLEGGTVVAFEYLWHDAEATSKVLLDKHEEINDEGQTVHYPKVRTSAIDDATKDDVGALRKDAVIVDTVQLTNLVPGRTYVVSGVLMDQATGDVFLVHGKEVRKTATVFAMEDGTLVSGNGEKITVTSYNEEKHEICGSVDLTFTFDARALEDRTCVVFENLYHRGIKVAAHADIKDKGQTVHFPKVRTQAKDSETKDRVAKVSEPGKTETLIDTVKYDNLVIGREYVVSGVLMNKKTAEKILDANGNEITASRTFTAGDEGDGIVITNRDEEKNSVSGTVGIEFTFDSSLLEGKTIVVFEDLFHEKIKVTSHANIKDKEQTVHYPKVRTSALEGVVGDEVGENNQTTIVDRVRFWNVMPGRTYTITGKLMDKDTGKPFTVDGKEVTASAELVVNEDGSITAPGGETTVLYSRSADDEYVDGAIDLTFEIPLTDLENKTLVVFEQLFYSDVKVAYHESLEDLGQTVHFPKIGTMASDKNTADDVGTVEENAQVIDVVEYSNLVIDKVYTISGQLYYQDTGKPVVGTDGRYVTASAKFRAVRESSGDNEVTNVNEDNYTVDGKYTLRFNLDTRQLQNKTVVVFEDLYHNGIRIATHSDIHDEGQSVHYPKIHTTAIDGYTGDHVATVSEQAKIVDTVAYNNLVIGREYTVAGTLMNKKTGMPLLDAEGNEIKASRTFVAGDEAEGIVVEKRDEENHFVDGTVDIVFTFDGSLLEDTTAVAFEKLIHNNIEVTVHEEITDEDQTVHFPKVRTSAIDGLTRDEVGTVAPTTIIDTVQLWNLVPGMSYTVSGVLMDKDTGEPLLVNGEKVVKSAVVNVTDQGSLKAEGGEKTHVSKYDTENKSVDGTVQLTYELDASTLENKTVVVFEDLIHNDITVAAHADLSDWGQTIHYPKVRTRAIDTDTSDHVGTVKEEAVVNDTVTYQNLVIGREYTLTGTLMCRDTGAPLLNEDGSVVTASATFTAGEESDVNHITKTYEADNEVDGEYVLTFTVDSRQLRGRTVVVFEDLYHNDVKVTAHADITDEQQAVHYPKVRTSATDVETGDHVGSIRGVLLNGSRKALGDNVNEDDLQVIRDTVMLTNLVPGETYVVSGQLYNADASMKAGEPVPLEINGSTIVQKAVITVSEDGSEIISRNGEKTTVTDHTDAFTDGTVELDFVIDSSMLRGDKVVVFEDLYHDDSYDTDVDEEILQPEDIVDSHSDYADEGQSVSEVDISTTALDADTNGHVGKVPTKGSYTVIRDNVHMAQLVIGMEYEIRGVLVELNASDLEHSKPMFLKADGTLTENRDEAYVSTFVFTAKDTMEKHNVNFAISSDKIQGMSLTVFEDLYHNGIKIASHPSFDEPGSWNKEDFKEQTVYYPTGKTNATDVVTGTHTSFAGERTVTDSVWFEDLLVGETYEIKGDLVYQKDFTDKNGVDHKAGDVIMTRTVAFTAAEDLDEVSYKDSDDKTAATNVVAKTYINGAKAISGYVAIDFTFDASLLEGATTVVEETFYNEGVPVFVHADLNDTPQTLKIPKISTTARVGDLDEASVYNEDGTFKDVTIVDTVMYENLWTQKELDDMAKEGLYIKYIDGSYRVTEDESIFSIGEDATYVIKGVLMDKETGKPLTNNDGGIYESMSEPFKPESPDGSVDITFTVNAGDFVKDGENLEGRVAVVFEDLYQVPSPDDIGDDNHVAEHHDIDDVEQDIRFPKGRTHAADGIPEDVLDSLPKGETDYHEALASLHEGESITEHEMLSSGEMVVTDLVSYSNLHGNTKYSVEGVLQVVTEFDENGVPVKWEEAKDDSGEVIKASAEIDTSKFSTSYDAYVSGYVPVVFRFSGLKLAGKTMVAFETFKRGDVVIGVHADINDSPQTVFVPKIRTHATDLYSDLDETLAGRKAYIVDKVSYENLEAGKTYTLNGDLHDRADGSDIGASASGTFVAGTDNQFIFPDGTKVMSMEEARAAIGAPATSVDVTDDEKAAPSDTPAAPAAPQGGSDAPLDTDSKTEYVVGKDIDAGYYKIIPGEDKTGSIFGYWCIYVGKDGNVPAERTLETVLANGILNKSGAADYILVENNMVLQLASWCNTTMTPVSEAEAKDKLNDMVKQWYERRDAETPDTADEAPAQAPEKEHDAQPADDAAKETSAGLRAGRCSGYVYLVIPVDASLLEGKTVVVFESLFTNDEGKPPKEVANHKDIEDEEQDIKFPKIRTRAGMSYDNLREGTLSITDNVSYENLTVGRTYIMRGELMDKATGLSTGVTAKAKFVPKTPSGTVSLVFTFDRDAFAGHTLVAFETLVAIDSEGHGWITAEHKDINDEAQTVKIPKIGTKAELGGTKELADARKQLITDTVSYQNLEVGVEYVMHGTLMDKETNEATALTAEKTFKPETEDGTVQMQFVLDLDSYAGKTLVAFEYLTRRVPGDEEKIATVAVHEDINDAAQTVPMPSIRTVATIDGKKSAPASSSTVVTDTVTYTNLIPGRSYTIYGALMNKESGTTTGVTAQTAFTPEAASGSVELKFTIDTTKLVGSHLVAFERLTTTNPQGEEYIVTVHEDLQDADQTVAIESPSEEQTEKTTPREVNKRTDNIDTGDFIRYGLIAGGSILAILLLILLYLKKRKTII